ncbi:sensor domain-containing diguanylate cyclase [Vibrio salinus]|uniref:sensor domain-containing diguanylate cyclase n=1 Tax=Vibrio salinus TaxID=2899784 RepID=UPI001E4414CA|nr:sensor domain-containing diguanylate cyclase [Vibrio salinus]MCE0492471.1 sensor domain-containing diguanylate cyclase [Vibrio salinus]
MISGLVKIMVDSNTVVITFDNVGHCVSTYGISVDMSQFHSFILDNGQNEILTFPEIPEYMLNCRELPVSLQSKSHQPWHGHLYKCSGKRANDTHYVAILSVQGSAPPCEQLQNIYDNMPAALFEFRHDENELPNFSYMSDYFMQLFGKDTVDLNKQIKDFFKLIHSTDREKVHISILNAERKQSEWECEFRVDNEDSTKWVYGHAIPVVSDIGTRYIGFLIDISAKKYLELKLIKESTIDPLTGAYNRRYFIEELNEELIRHHHNPQFHVSLLAIDFDLFKNINDKYGHDMGDMVLQTISKLIMKNIRKTDCFARVGGEEFSLILPNTNSKAALRIAEKIRSLVEKTNINYQGLTVSITITIGVASTDSGCKEVKHIMNRADKALYEGKESGRNCVK